MNDDAAKRDSKTLLMLVADLRAFVFELKRDGDAVRVETAHRLEERIDKIVHR